MNAHELAKMLLRGENYPVIIPAMNGTATACFVTEVELYHHTDSPFEYCLFLNSNSNHTPEELEVAD